MTPTPPIRRLRAARRVLLALARRASPVEPEAAALDGLVGPGGVCVDVGAEYGLYTFVLAGRVGPAGRVYAFEPLPGPRRFLVALARRLGAGNVQVREVALGETRGTATLSLPRRRGLPVHGRAFLVDRAHHYGPNTEFSGDEVRVSVAVSTLDDVVDGLGLQRLDLVKIDVEGAEPAVLRGASRTIARLQPAFLVEIEDRHLAKYGDGSGTVIGLLADHGYRMSRLVDGRWEPTDTVTDGHRNYLFTLDPSRR